MTPRQRIPTGEVDADDSSSFLDDKSSNRSSSCENSSAGAPGGISTDGSSTNGRSSSGNSTGNSSFELFGFTRMSFQAISCSRWIFLGTLLVSAVGLATAVYFVLENEQVEDFQVEFNTLAVEVIDVANEHVQNVFNLMDGVTSTVTSFIEVQADDPSFQYPRGFLTLPHMEEHFGSARNASGASVLAYVPLIQPDALELWANYSFENQGWIARYNAFHNDDGLVDPILKDIWDYSEDDEFHAYLKDECEYKERSEMTQDFDTANDELRIPLKPQDRPFSPIWTFSPAPKPSDTTIINHDLFSRDAFKAAVQTVDSTRKPLFLDVCNLANWFNVIGTSSNSVEAVVAYPVFEDFSGHGNIVGHMIEILPWAYFFKNILPEGTEPVKVVLESSCGRASAYEIRGRQIKLLNPNQDLHNEEYNAMAVSSIFADFANSPEVIGEGLEGVCIYTVSVYPTAEFESAYESQKPVHYALVVLSVFVCTSMLFFLFDFLMTRQRNRVMDTAKKQNAIVSSLFPKNIQAKMMQDLENNKLSKIGKAGLKSYLFDTQTPSRNDVNNTEASAIGGFSDKSKPIADLFPETTIMFGDIAGFTAWSSAREPSQVFILLETIFHEFDRIAKRRRVFKVEVVGDCYVAVCGLPDPRTDHAVIMAKFAMDCVKEMDRLTLDLERELGPDTTELALRVGLHSGPVVAGVLRGEKSRFQLFGDAMNTASRMESTGLPRMVQISQETADLLAQASKTHWFEPRGEKIQAKGKGQLSTYFLKVQGSDKTARSVRSASDDDNTSIDASLHSFRDGAEVVEKRNRIADWTVETMSGVLKEIVVRRKAEGTKSLAPSKLLQLEKQYTGFHRDGSTMMDEVKEIIELPNFDAEAAEREANIDASAIALSQQVVEELRDFVQTIASMYHDNPFHNFPHANHVTMSVVKLLSRIVAPDVEEVTSNLHDHTYGITSDPLTRFSVVLAALIHDVDHMGVPNAQLVKEQDPVAQLYDNKSVAEQNSIDLAWDLLMEPRFTTLRHHIYTTEGEFKRFRQLVVNSVMATDIMDKDLKELRNKRWADAFSVEQQKDDDSRRQAVNRKATIVIAHLIQASDVAHTMQHWHIYRKWNERLFQEMYKAFEEGRMENNPAENWYRGEMGFFDFYIIPLAKKLKECGVFGVSSDEYLSYALQNRKEWEARGETLVQEMVMNVKRKHVAKSVYAASQTAVDPQGREIVAEMAAALRHREASSNSDSSTRSRSKRRTSMTNKTEETLNSSRGDDDDDDDD